jgi:polyphosphate kinase 2 PPK2
MWIAYCSNAPAEHAFHLGVLKSSEIPQVGTRRAREPCPAKRKICLAPQNRDDISVGQSLTRGEILDLTTAKIAQQFCLSDRFDNLCAINLFHARVSRIWAIIKIFLHLSKEEQRRRLLARIDEPEKNWKFSGTESKSQQKRHGCRNHRDMT